MTPASELNLKSDGELKALSLVYGLSAQDLEGLDHAGIAVAIAKKAGYQGASLVIEDTSPALTAGDELEIQGVVHRVEKVVADEIIALRAQVKTYEEKIAADAQVLEDYKQRFEGDAKSFAAAVRREAVKLLKEGAILKADVHKIVMEVSNGLTAFAHKVAIEEILKKLDL